MCRAASASGLLYIVLVVVIVIYGHRRRDIGYVLTSTTHIHTLTKKNRITISPLSPRANNIALNIIFFFCSSN